MALSGVGGETAEEPEPGTPAPTSQSASPACLHPQHTVAASPTPSTPPASWAAPPLRTSPIAPWLHPPPPAPWLHPPIPSTMAAPPAPSIMAPPPRPQHHGCTPSPQHHGCTPWPPAPWLHPPAPSIMAAPPCPQHHGLHPLLAPLLCLHPCSDILGGPLLAAQPILSEHLLLFPDPCTLQRTLMRPPHMSRCPPLAATQRLRT